MPQSAFTAAFAIVVGEEGGFTDNPADPGNWTGGKCHVGECKGTHWGISAASYPKLDIAALSLADAQAIYQRDYWLKFHCDEMPPPLALLVFDTGINGGHPIAWLQAALRVSVDGKWGPKTRAAAMDVGGRGAEVVVEFLALRLIYDSALANWPVARGGWSRRVLALPFRCAQMAGA